MSKKTLFWFMIVAAAIVTAWRTFVLPSVVGNGVSLTHVDYPLLLLMVVVAATALLLGREKGGYASYTESSRSVLVGGAIFGLVLAASSLWDIVCFMWQGQTPPPCDAVVSAADRVLLTVSMLAGFLGGLFLAVWFIGLLRSPSRPFNRKSRTALLCSGCFTAVLLILLFFLAYQEEARALDAAGAAAEGAQRVTVILPLMLALAAGIALIVTSARAARRHTFSEKWMWLLLPLWAFARLARYNVVYAASVDISPAVYEFLLYALVLLFLMECARWFSGVQKPSGLRGLAAATAVLCAAASVSRFVLFLLGEHAAVMYCSIPSVTEAALGIFAGAVAMGIGGVTPRHFES